MIRLVWVSVVCLLTLVAPSAQQPSIDDFFRDLSDGWVRLNPNIAVAHVIFRAKNRIASSSRSRRIPMRPSASGSSISSADASSSRASIGRA